MLAWDGTLPSFIHEMLRQGKLPSLAKLIEGSAFADDVTVVIPSLTAPGFASLLTGASPRITGITGIRVPRTPRNDLTILESATGFNSVRAQFSPNTRAIDYSPVRRYIFRQLKGVVKFPIRGLLAEN